MLHYQIELLFVNFKMSSQTQVDKSLEKSDLRAAAPVFLPQTKLTSSISIMDMVEVSGLRASASDFLPKNPIPTTIRSEKNELVDTVKGNTIFTFGFFSPSAKDLFPDLFTSSSSPSESRLNIWTSSHSSRKIFPSSK